MTGDEIAQQIVTYRSWSNVALAAAVIFTGLWLYTELRGPEWSTWATFAVQWAVIITHAVLRYRLARALRRRAALLARHS